MQKTFPSYSHSRNSSAFTLLPPSNNNSPQRPEPIPKQTLGNSSFRASSPNSKTKIKLVSPLKDRSSIHYPSPKENHPPRLASSFSQLLPKKSIEIQLGGTSTSKPLANKPSGFQPREIVQTVVQPFPEPFFKKTTQVGLVQTTVRHQSPIRVQSPPKIHINNKCFDLGAIKSQVVYVTPLHQRKISSETPHIAAQTEVFSKSADSFYHNPNWPSQLVIQEQNQIEQLKESYQSELKEIKQLQQQIEDNNLQIKELLKSSRVSRDISSSRVSNQVVLNPSEENFAAEVIAESSKREKVQIKLGADEVSVQTDNIQLMDDHSTDRNESRCSKFSITKNKECQIQVLCTVASSKVPQFQPISPNKQEIIDSPIKQHDNEVSRYEVNVNLKASRVDSEMSPIKYSRYQIQLQQRQSERIIKPALPFPEEPPSITDDIFSLFKLMQQEPLPKKESEDRIQIEKVGQQRGSEKLMGSQARVETALSSVSSGKRRINNSIYL